MNIDRLGLLIGAYLLAAQLGGCAATMGETISDFAVLNRGDFNSRGPQGLPMLKPPYSRIVAIDMKTGEHAWETTSGDTPERIRNHPALAALRLR